MESYVLRFWETEFKNLKPEKTRTGHRFCTPVDAVEFRKQRKMIHAAQFFLAEKRLQHRDARFDVVGVSWAGREPFVEHIENAFELT